MSDQVVYLMRGLPSSGKSFPARTLAGEQGLILETDQYFGVKVGDVRVYRYSEWELSCPKRQRSSASRCLSLARPVSIPHSADNSLD
jgi:hypothetical protein